MVIVAHSMGGLVVRDAMNRCTGAKRETKVRALITIASPLGGHPAARSAAHAPVVIPSWRDLNPDSAFIRNLYRTHLPAGLEYHLWYTYGYSRTVKLGENSDGTVPLSCQLVAAAQNEAKEQFGFNDTHTGVLRNPETIQRVPRVISEVKGPFPEDHLRELLKGGYAVELGKDYTPIEAYCIHNAGHYMDALVAGKLTPIHPLQVHFVAACRGEVRPNAPVETAWIKLNRQFPDRSVLK